MAHLSKAELVDWCDGTLSAPRAAHVDACATCRLEAERLRLDMSRIAQESACEVPEPSPLFWDHLSDRVRQGIRDAGQDAHRARPFARPIWTALAGSAIALGLAIAIWTTWSSSGSIEQGETAAVTVPQAGSAQNVVLDLEADEDWALVRIAADSLQWENAHEAGLSARPGAADRVALEMSPEERQELARLIEDELKRTGA